MRDTYTHTDLFAFTETWITSSSTSAELFNVTPGFTLISCPRPAATTLTKYHIVGGGIAFLIHEPPPFFLRLRTVSKYLKCHLSLLNSLVPTLLSSISIVILQLPPKLANQYPIKTFSLILILSSLSLSCSYYFS